MAQLFLKVIKAMFRPFSLFIGSRYANLKRKDHFITFLSLVSMIGIALGVMVLITVLSVMNGFTKEIRTRILSVTPHLTVSQWGQQPVVDWRGLANIMSKHKEVVATGPYIDGQGMFIQSGQMRGTIVKGVLPEEIEAVFPLKEILVAGSLENLQPGKFGAILGVQLAKHLGVGIGDKVTLVVPEVMVSMAGAMPRMKRLEVVGIFEIGYIYDHSYAFMHIEDAGKLFKMDGGVTGVQAKLADPFSAPRLVRDLKESFPPGYVALDWTTLNGTYFSAVKMEKTMMFFTLMMILAIAVFNLVSTLIMVVTDKRADIAVLRTLGASTRKVMNIFIFQGAMIGTVGTIVGVILGVTLALNVTDLVSFIERVFSVQFLSSDVYFISFLPSDLKWKDVVIIGFCSLGLSLIATILPARRAANVVPAEALRHDN
jgi:lipoprotein-releasing system permease protein